MYTTPLRRGASTYQARVRRDLQDLDLLPAQMDVSLSPCQQNKWRELAKDKSAWNLHVETKLNAKHEEWLHRNDVRAQGHLLIESFTL